MRIRGRTADLVQPDTRSLRNADAVRVLLVVDDEQPLRELHFVRMGAGRNADLPQHSRSCGIGDVDDARSDAEVAHVPDVEHVAVPHDLHAVALAIEIGVADELEPASLEGTR